MSKYIIDIDDFEPMFKVDSIGVFGIGKSVTDSEEDHSWSRIKSIEEFEELNSDYISKHFSDLQDDAYHRGLSEGNDIGYKDGVKDGQNEAWECAKKLFSSMADSDIEKAFPIEWNNGGFYALMNLQPQEAIAKLKAYEEKHQTDDKIKVGDEVEWDNDFTGDRFIVTRIYQPYGKKEQCDGIDDDGDVYRAVLVESLVKTGRHFGIASILKEMQS